MTSSSTTITANTNTQVEGLVADYDLTLGDLIGTIKTFFERIGALFLILLYTSIYIYYIYTSVYIIYIYTYILSSPLLTPLLITPAA